jgi:hypothetical protein
MSNFLLRSLLTFPYRSFIRINSVHISTYQETMKLPSFTISALIATGNVLSIAQNYAIVDAATAKAHQPKKKEAPKLKEEQKEERTLEEMRSILRNKIKAKTELRMKTAGLRGGHPRLTGRKCNPGVGKGNSYMDVGVLSCELATHYCLEDLLSSTGGVCAEVVSEDEAGSEKVASDADVPVEGVVPGEVGEVGSEDEASVVVGADVIGARVGDGDSDVDEDEIKVLRLLTPKDMLILQRLLEEKFAGGSTEECTAQSNGDFIVDAGILSGCKNSSYVCMPDSSSSKGGICLDFKLPTNDVERAKVNGGEGRRHLTQCTYRNGTAGVKCQGSRACGGLTSSFISTNIGCGSCNSYGACNDMTGEFVNPKYILSSVVVLLIVSYSLMVPLNISSS